MDKSPLRPSWLVAGAWVLVLVLALGAREVGSRLQASWEATPPTQETVTNCDIDAMMGGDNPVEVGQIRRACLEAATEAYVEPRTTRFRIFTALLLLAAFLGALALTWRLLASGAPSRVG